MGLKKFYEKIKYFQNRAIINRNEVARIVGDAAIATAQVDDGRLIPLIIVDVGNHPKLGELIRVHQHLSPGDVESRWVKFIGSMEMVALHLSFKKPIETTAVLIFDVIKQGIIVDQILATKTLYLQSGKEGDKLSANLDAPKIFIEIPDTGFKKDWENIFFYSVANHMKREGLGRRQAKQAARQWIEEMRKVGQIRIKS